jgi:acetyl esterase/lipase
MWTTSHVLLAGQQQHDTLDRRSPTAIMTRTIEEIMALANMDPELEQISKHAPEMPDITQYEPAQLRAGAKLRAPRVLPGVSDESIANVHIEDITIPARDGFAIPARVYKPVTGPKDGSPLVVIFHGGGFVLGGLDQEHPACKNFVKLYAVVAISVDYRLAPEHKFPAGVNDAWDSVKWV